MYTSSFQPNTNLKRIISKRKKKLSEMNRARRVRRARRAHFMYCVSLKWQFAIPDDDVARKCFHICSANV